MSQEAYDKAMEELETLEKSLEEKDGNEDIDALTKALEEEISEDLQKSDDGDADDAPGEEEAEDDDEDDTKKSQDDGYADELVKASEAYADLEKSVKEFAGDVTDDINSLRKSIAAQMNLMIKIAKVLAPTSQKIDALSKSLDEVKRQPMVPNKAQLGIGTSISEPMSKSVAEVTDLLVKAVQEQKVDARWLGVFGTYKDANRLPEDVKTAIGL